MKKIFQDNLDFIAKNAVLDACTGANPRQIDDEAMKKLFICSYYKKEVDF